MFLLMKQENTEEEEGRKGGGGGDIPTRSSSSPRGFTLYYVCMLSFLQRVLYVLSLLPTSHPSTICSEVLFTEIAARFPDAQ